MLRDIAIQSQNRRHVDDLHISPKVIHHNRRRRIRSGRGEFQGSFEFREVAGEGEGGASEDGARLEGPGGEGRDESGGLERIFLVGLGRLRRGGLEIGGDEGERSVLRAEMEEVVVLRLAFFDYAAAGCAFRYRYAGGRGGAPSLRR